MVKLNWKGEEETFFHYDGKRFETKNKKLDVPEEVAKKVLSNPKWERTSKVKDFLKSYKEELINLPGIGEKKAEDIISVYPIREELVNAVKTKKNLAWNEDVDSVLKKHFGGGN